MPIRHRIAPLTGEGCPSPVLCGIRRDFSRLSLCDGQVAYVLLTRAPVAGRSKQAYSPAAPRLACVKPVASVHPEPGSNSSLLYIVFSFSFQRKQTTSFTVVCLKRLPYLNASVCLRRRMNRLLCLDRIDRANVLLLYYFVFIVSFSMFFRYRSRLRLQS